MAANDDTRVKKRRRKPSRPEQLSESAQEERSARSRKKRHTLPRILFRLLLVAALAVSCLWISRNFDSLSPASVSDWLDEKLSGGVRGDGFPMTIDGDAVISVGTLGDSLAVLSDNALTIYNKNAGEVARRLHNYAAPAMKLAKKYALVADVGGTRITLETRSDTVLEFTAPDSIVTVALAPNGRFAVATGADKSHTSKVTVYDRRGNELYSWVSADLMVVDMAFDPTGSRVAVAGVTAKNADLHSALTILNVSGEAPVSYTADRIMLCATAFLDAQTVAAVGSDVLWVAKADGSEKTEYAYDDRELMSFSVGSSLIGLLLRPYGSADGGELVVLDSTGQPRQCIAFDDTFRCLSADGNRMLLLTDRELAAYTVEGLQGQVTTSADGRLVTALNGRPLVVGLTAVTEYTLQKSGAQ